MSEYYRDKSSQPPDDQDPKGQGPQKDDLWTEQVKFAKVSARVPEHIARGSFSTGALVMTGPNEFVVDFVLRLSRPHHLVARVVLPHNVMAGVIQALDDNILRYQTNIGPIPTMPKPPPNQPRPSVEEIYNDLKFDDQTLLGGYANAAMISHSPAEFCFDFVSSFFPRSVVCHRVFMSAAHVPPLLESLKNSYRQWQERKNNPPPLQPPPSDAPPPTDPAL